MKKLLLAFLVMVFAQTVQAAQRPTVTLTPQNMITLRDEVTDESVSRLILELSEFQGDTVYFYINSPGGSVVDGNRLINAIKASGKKVVCIADFAASMAFSIFQSCTERLIVDSAIIMQHQMSFGAKGSLSEMQTQLQLAEKLAQEANQRDAARLGLDVKVFQAKIHDEWWLFDDEALEAHAADGKVDVRCSAALSKKREVQVVESLFGTATLTWSGCPLATYPVSVKIDMKKGVDLRDFHEWARDLHLDQNWKIHREVK